MLDYMQAKTLLDKYEIKSVESKYVDSEKSAADFAKNDPIVLKVLSDNALHKSKAGLVKLGLTGTAEVSKAFSELEKRGKEFAPYKILAQKMAMSGVEIIIGGATDPQFGKMVMLGLGGIYVEAFKDTALRVCPITKHDAEEMIDQLKSKSVITFNGTTTTKLVTLLLNFSKMFLENGKLKEVDLNPVIMRQDGYDVVDIRMLV